MRLTLDWRIDGSQATIRQGGVGAARLFGLPFLAVGAYFGYQFLDGVLHPGELTWAGWTLLPLMAAVFLVPGWILVAGRRRTRIDSARREVIRELDYIVYTHRTTYRVTHDSHVMLRYEQGSTSSTRGAITTSTSTRFDIHVYVETPGQPPVLIGLFAGDQKTDALAFAGKAAAFLTLPVKDRLVERGEVNAGGVVVDHADEEDEDTN